MHPVRTIQSVIVFVVLLSGSTFAQREGHIEWIVSSGRVADGGALLVINAIVDSSWHLYSKDIGEGGPLPTSVRLAPGAYELRGGLKEYGIATELFDNTFQMDIKWYESNVLYTQEVRYKEPVTIAGEIEYMICSDKLCIPGKFKFRQSLP